MKENNLKKYLAKYGYKNMKLEIFNHLSIFWLHIENQVHNLTIFTILFTFGDSIFLKMFYFLIFNN